MPWAMLPGTAKADLSMHPRRCPAPQLYTGVFSRSGRWVPCELVLAASVFIERPKGVPPCSVVMPLSCQPPNAVFRNLFVVAGMGMAYMYVARKRWRISKGALP